ncbi:LutC/YkgG family protein [Spirabiliibacterium falconis]|uniref:LutC/YkgG family protein n=1 Tax=Spirabiliibacterium falconis TaxID=572023 RepID=UPI001AAC5F1A|nr:lactate utilization protein C [Spirabiliibacterium falconis]MBE2894771.1 lactate utilization protein C [Spirabiliibacterium falconis]
MLDTTNRDQFLARLAAQLGREVRTQVQGDYAQLTDAPKTRLTELDSKNLLATFMLNAQALEVDCLTTRPAEVGETILALCEKYGGGDVIINDDTRLQALGVVNTLSQHYQTHIWSPESAVQNRTFAANANIGIVFAEYGLTESGGIVLYSDKHFGRSVSLLPPVSMVLLKRSSILPRVAQLASILDQKAAKGERMPSCINIISGPSATADIELVKVVGVHGPVKNVYVIIDDV